MSFRPASFARWTPNWLDLLLVGLSFALIAAGILLSDYFIQFSVVPISLMN